MTTHNDGDDSQHRRTVLKALGVGGLAAAGIGGGAGSAAAESHDGAATLTGDLAGVTIQDARGVTIGSFESGTLSVESLRIEPSTGDLLVGGKIDGEIESGLEVSQTFSGVPGHLSSDDGCTTLFLKLGPVSVDVRGLTLQLVDIELDVGGDPVDSGLLRSLLCAVADLDDDDVSNASSETITRLNDFLDYLLG